MRRCENCVHARFVLGPTPCIPGVWECSARGGMTVLHPVARAVAYRAYASRYKLHVEDGYIWVSRDGLERFARFAASVGVDAARLFGRDDGE